MMTLLRSATVLTVLSLASVAALGGCAGGGSDDGTANGTSNLTSASPTAISINLQNWLTHPAIVEVRNITEAIDASQLKIEKRTFCANQGVGEFERDKDTDPTGKVRKLVIQAGSEDGAEETSYYYDTNGKLRFVFQTDNDVHGNSSEMRVYFDAAGARLWDVFRSASDPKGNNPDVSKAPFVAPPEPIQVGAEFSNPATVFDGPAKCG